MDMIYILYILYFVSFVWGVIALVMAIQNRIEHNAAKIIQINNANEGKNVVGKDDLRDFINMSGRQNLYALFSRFNTDVISGQAKNKILANNSERNKSDYYRNNKDTVTIFTMKDFMKTESLEKPQTDKLKYIAKLFFDPTVRDASGKWNITAGNSGNALSQFAIKFEKERVPFY